MFVVSYTILFSIVYRQRPEFFLFFFSRFINRNNYAKAHERRISIPPEAFGDLRISFLPFSGIRRNAICAAQLFSRMNERTAPNCPGIEADGFCPRIFGRRIRNTLIKISVILVQRPFSDIAVHVVESPGIRTLFAYFVINIVAVFQIPGMLIKFCILIAKRILVCTSCATGVFPFSFSRQTEKMSRYRA